MEKIQIFDQNHGLTPLQKFEFCHFLKRHFYVTEYIVSIKNISKQYFSAYLAQTQNMEKNPNF